MAKVKPDIDQTSTTPSKQSSFKLDGLTGRDGECFWHMYLTNVHLLKNLIPHGIVFDLNLILHSWIDYV